MRIRAFSLLALAVVLILVLVANTSDQEPPPSTTQESSGHQTKRAPLRPRMSAFNAAVRRT